MAAGDAAWHTGRKHTTIWVSSTPRKHMGGLFRQAGRQPRCAQTLVHRPKQLAAGSMGTLGPGGGAPECFPGRGQFRSSTVLGALHPTSTAPARAYQGRSHPPPGGGCCRFDIPQRSPPQQRTSSTHPPALSPAEKGTPRRLLHAPSHTHSPSAPPPSLPHSPSHHHSPIYIIGRPATGSNRWCVAE